MAATLALEAVGMGAALASISRLDCLARQSHPWVTMEAETKFLRLFEPAALGDRIDGWRVCWVGGWDKCRILFVVVVEKPPRPSVKSAPPSLRS